MWKFWLSAVAGLFCLLAWLVMRQEGAESQRWPTTQGTVIEMRLTDHVDRDGSRDKNVSIRYKYVVAGKEYQGDRIGVGTSYDAEAAAKKYPERAQVTVYYNPQRPGDAVLETGAGGTILWGLAGVGFLA